MLLDSPKSENISSQSGAETDIHKVRIRFRKDGNLRLVSHHDLMHVFERTFRRSQIPFRSTSGYHPKPKMVFALSLALGIVGCEEVLEVELEPQLTQQEIFDRLVGHTPPGLTIQRVQPIDAKTKARVCRVSYRILIPDRYHTNLPSFMKTVWDSPEWWIERTRPKIRKINLRPFLADLRFQENYLEMDLWVSPSGMARPEEVLQAMGIAEILEEGMVFERTKLVLEDEMAETNITLPEMESREEGKAVEKSSRPRPAPLFPGPLSFDS